jgi:hypothetical protein
LTLDALFPADKNEWNIDVWATRDLVVASYLLDHPAKFNTYSRIIFTTYSESLADIGLSEVGHRIAAAAWRKWEWRISTISRLTLRQCILKAVVLRSCAASSPQQWHC